MTTKNHQANTDDRTQKQSAGDIQLPRLSDLLEAALDYHRRGWSIIPTTINRARGNWKKAAVPWKSFQITPPTESEVRGMFHCKRNLTGVAVVLGPVSGNLYARDFDDLTAYANWSTAHPDLAKALPTVATGRGIHIYFRSTKPVTTKELDDGELRGEGGYIVLPPSVHHTGTLYRW
ncbi:MAG: bifunctional DNA primase/polymerase, partial [Verrucomicrobiota bacterium]